MIKILPAIFLYKLSEAFRSKIRDEKINVHGFHCSISLSSLVAKWDQNDQVVGNIFTIPEDEVIHQYRTP